MAIELRVLGTLEIRQDGEPVALRAPAPRTMLAALLIERNRVVSVDRISEALWPEAPPRTKHALEMNASRVRRALGDGATLAARPPGYVLEVAEDALDSVRFERLLAEARDLGGADPRRAATRAGEALALWRGAAYEDFTFSPFAQDEIARLEELRQEAEEVRLAAELAQGHAAELIGELEAHVAAAPLREARHAQLMLALYRAGRQADALAAYRAARERLLDELGLEPGPELRELEGAILRQDRDLEAGAAAATRPAGSRRPATVIAVEPEISLSLDPEEHERRRSEAAELVERVAQHFGALHPEPFVLAFAHEDHAERAAAAAADVNEALEARVGVASGDALVGGAHVGGPLVELARRRAREPLEDEALPSPQRRADGPFVGRAAELARLRKLDAAVIVGPAGIGKSRLARELGRESTTAAGRCRPYGDDALAPLHEIAAALGRPESFANIHADEVPLTLRRLCEAAAPLLVVIDDVQWADVLVIAAIEQLVARAGAGVRVLCLAREELLEDQPSFLAAAERIQLGPLGHDAAVALAGGDRSVAARAEGNPLFIEQLLAFAADTQDELPTSLRALLAARLDRLPPGERSVADCAAVIGREFAVELVAELADASGARAAVAALVRRGLAEPATADEAFRDAFRFRHGLILESTYESIPRAERARLHERLADLLAERGGADETIGLHLEHAATLRPERDRHAQQLAEDAGARLAAAGMAVFRRGYTARAAALLRRAVALLPEREAARRLLLCELAVAEGHGPGAATLEEAVEAAVEAADRRIELRARLELAAMRSPGTVVEIAAEAIPVFDALGDDRGLGRVWVLSGWVEGGLLGRCARWEEAAERALEHYRRAGYPVSTCIAQIAAALYHGPTPVATATARLEQLFAVVDDLPGRAAVLAYLGGLATMRGETGDASSALAEARALYTELGRTQSIVWTCMPLEADAARLAGDAARAIEILRAACTAPEQDATHLATHASTLAELLQEAGDDEAVHWAAESRRAARADDVWAQIDWRVADAVVNGDEESAREAVARVSDTDVVRLRARAFAAAGDHAAAVRMYEEKGNVAAARVAAAATSPPGRD